MRDPQRERLGNRLFIGEAALGPLSLELPVQIGRQPNRCFKRRTGAHTTRLLKFGLCHQNANAGRRLSRIHPTGKPSLLRECLCSSFRTVTNLSYTRFIRSQSWMQGICSEFRTERRSKAGRRGIFPQVRGRLCDTRAHSPERPALLPGFCRPDRCAAAPETNHRQLNTIIMYSDNNYGDFAVLLLANHWYLLYKV
jgi:hypothetical protein